MRVVSKHYYYFEKQDKLDFLMFLKEKNTNILEFSSKCSVSISYMSLILSGKRALNDNIINNMKSIGYELKLGD